MADQRLAAKLVPGTRCLVDGFGITPPLPPAAYTYFLTHAHSDHTVGEWRVSGLRNWGAWEGWVRFFCPPAPNPTLPPTLTGLRRSFPHPIHCSPVTAALITRDTPRVPPSLIVPLHVGEAVRVHDVGRGAPPVVVTAHDANHCPGALVLTFDVPARGDGDSNQPRRIVHTGDCRWHDGLSAAIGRSPRVDVLLLDTTYSHPRHDHPPQAAAIAAAAGAMAQEVADAAAGGAPRPRIVVGEAGEERVEKSVRCCFPPCFQPPPHNTHNTGSYRIGKERLYLGLASALGATVWLPPAKRRVLSLTGLGDSPCLVSDAAAADILVVPMGAALSGPALAAHLPADGFGRVIGVRPTGWAWRGGSGQRGGDPSAPPTVTLRPYSPAPGVVMYGVPYSEHSSFPELRACVAALRPRVLIPTVTGGRAGTPAAVVARFSDLLAPDGPVGRGRIDFFFGARRVEEAGGGEEGQEASAPARSPSPPPAASDATPTPPNSWGPALDDDWSIDEGASDPPRAAAAAAALATAQPFDLAAVDVASQRAALAAVQPGAKRQATLATLWRPGGKKSR